MKRQTGFAARTLAMAVMAAMLGFCYSIVTQADHAGARSFIGVEPRVVGSSNLRLLLPASAAFPGDFDLGDACYGSVITRYVTATGGLRPYNFISPNLATVIDATSTLTLTNGGVLRGQVSPPPANSFTDLQFQVTAADSTRPTANTTTQNAHITLVPSGAQLFRFAQDRLNDGVLGQPYICKLETLSGKGSVFIGVVPGTLAINGVPVGVGNSLESIGLSMAFDGTLYGRPLKTGLVSFTAFGIDSLNRLAKDRTNSVQNQAVSFSVSDTRITATDATILGINAKGDLTRFNGDSLTFHAFINMNGRKTTDLLGTRFALIIGGGTYEGFMDENGIIGNQLHNPLIFPDGTRLTGKVDSVNGVITGALTRANLGDTLDAVNIVNRSTKRIAVAIVIHNFVVASDIIEFQTKRVGNRFGLQYNIGRVGRPLGGGFQIYSIAGADSQDIAGNPGDAWTAKFLIYPRFGIDDVNGGSADFSTNLTSVGVRIGTNFTQTIPVSEFKIAKNGALTLKKPATFGQQVNKMQINPSSYSGFFITNPISVNATGTLQSTDVNAADTFFNAAVDINRVAPNASFSGEDAKFIRKAPAIHRWVDRNTKKPKP